MDRRRFLAASAAAGSPALLGCRRAGQPGGRPRVRVATTPYLGSSSLYLAQERGYYAEAGIDVELRELAGSTQVIPLLAGGKVEVAGMSLSAAVINAAARGAELRIVSAREDVRPGCGFAGALFVRGAIPRGTAHDLGWLRGKRISIPNRASFAEFSLDVILEQGGLRPDEVEVALLPRQEGAAALAGGKIDGMINNEMLALGPLSSPAVRMVTTLGDVLPGHQYAFVMFGRNLLTQDADAGVRFLRAYIRASRDFAAGASPAFMDQLARKGGLDPEFLRGLCRDTHVFDGRIDLPSIDRTLDWAARKGYSEQRLDAGRLLDTRFLDQVQEGMAA
ncbi:MAG TPA: ABC transporter substrate-binding protein [Bryobacteraceae bacterium]|nr:ABC transporter substrate-binding protein [Bryobacteraceae bacterium]